MTNSADKPPKPAPLDWDWLDAITGSLDNEFVAATEEELAHQERPELDTWL